MKTGLSSIELRFVVTELQDLVGSKIDKIFQPSKTIVYLQLFKTGAGKKVLSIRLPSFMYLTGFKEESPAKIMGFCATLRKYLQNARLASIRQVPSERIVEFRFEAKDEVFILIAELFSKGNMLLCREDLTIILPLLAQEWKDRKLASKEKYAYPPQGLDIFMLERQQLRDILSEERELVRKLATSLGLGGTFAEEICLRAGLDKESGKQTSKDIDRILSAIKEVLTDTSKPCIVLQEGKPIDVIPKMLRIYDGSELKMYDTFNEALDAYLTDIIRSGIRKEKQTGQNSQIKKTQKIIEMQETNLHKLKQEAEENQRKGELIYENYGLAKEVLDTLRKAREKYSWPEIKEKLKGHRLIKGIDEKQKKVIIDI